MVKKHSVTNFAYDESERCFYATVSDIRDDRGETFSHIEDGAFGFILEMDEGQAVFMIAQVNWLHNELISWILTPVSSSVFMYPHLEGVQCIVYND